MCVGVSLIWGNETRQASPTPPRVIMDLITTVPMSYHHTHGVHSVPQNAHVTLLARFAAAPRSRPPGVSLSRPPPPKQTRGALIEPSSHFARRRVSRSHETHEH